MAHGVVDRFTADVDLFTDREVGVAALERYSVGQVIGFARRLDPGLEDRDFSDAGLRLDRMDDGAFARFGLSPQDIAELRDRFASWPRV